VRTAGRDFVVTRLRLVEAQTACLTRAPAQRALGKQTYAIVGKNSERDALLFTSPFLLILPKFPAQ